MRIGLAGDWHGNSPFAQHVLHRFKEAGIREVYQLGDFGLGWPGHGARFLAELHGVCRWTNIRLKIVPGNHENWDWINAREFNEHRVSKLTSHISILGRNWRGEIGGRTAVALGGAPSIDYQQRTQGRDWWAEEMITLADVELCVAEGEADIMLAHDAPDGGTRAVQRIIDHPHGWTTAGLNYAAEGRELMNMAVAGVRPKVFAHGHYHVAGIRQTSDTLWLSLHCDGNELAAGILDTETLEFEWLPLL